jgi:SAM-dependent methyltransferase
MCNEAKRRNWNVKAGLRIQIVQRSSDVNDALSEKTIADFGAQWTRFVDNEGYYGSIDYFLDTVSPLMSLNDVGGATVADIGSGNGRFALILLAAGAKHVYAVEPSAAFEVLKRNTEAQADRITLLNIKGEDLPAGLNLDLVFSYGVIHHIPEPLPTMRAAYNALRPGGKCCVWLYGREGNGFYLAVATPLRWITTRLPDWALRGISKILNIAADMYGAACRYLPLPLGGYMRDVFGKLERRRRYEVIFDQLNPAYAKYYREDEARTLFEQAGFSHIKLHHRHGYSWTVVGIHA